MSVTSAPPPGSADGLRPVGAKVIRVLLGLRVGRDHRGALNCGERRERGLVDGAGLLHGIRAHGPSEALQEEVLALVAEDELLPQPSRSGGWAVLVDRLE